MRLPGSLATRWQRASRRERIAFGVATVLLTALIGEFAIWTPLQRELTRAQADLALSQALLARAQRQADESVGLARSATGNPPAVRAAVDRMLAQRGLRGAVTALDTKDGRTQLVFAAIRIDVLISALDSLARDAGIRAMEATLTARVEPGTVRADLALAR